MEASESDHSGILLFLTAIIIVFTIILGFKQEHIDIIVEGPMTQQEYIQVQDVLAYQAWLDNLVLSPIGKL